MPYKPANLGEIDTKLREDFRRRLIEAGYQPQQADVNDPILRVLFRSFASQIESLYEAPEHVREAFLDELISGLGFEPRMARPAQTVVRFYSGQHAVVAAGSNLIGETPTGEKLTFTTDETVSVSAARIAFTAIYQKGTLQLAQGMHLSDELLSAQPSYDPVPAALGPASFLYVVVEDLPESHLAGHSFFFDVSAVYPDVQRALLRATWCAAAETGRFEAAGILRPRRANAGVRVLEWLHGKPRQDSESTSERPELPDGFYSGKVVVFPDVPPDRRLACAVPKPLEAAMGRLFRRPATNWNTPRAWIRILLPDIPNLHNAIQSIALHAMSASNVADFNQTITFEKQGTSIPVSREAGTNHFLVAPLSVTSEDNTSYISEYHSSSDARAGRFAVRNGRIDLVPARKTDGSADRIVTLRTWVTSGALGNTVPAGKVQTFLKPDDSTPVRMNNPMPAAGGSDGEPLESAQARFARALLSRDRIVTKTDLDCAVRSFDHRIVDVTAHSGLEPSARGLIRVQRVVLSLAADLFQDPEEESRVLRDELEDWLRERLLCDIQVVVDCAWAERARA